MADPILRTNPYRQGGSLAGAGIQNTLGFGPPRVERWPDTGKTVKLGPCPKCEQKGVVLFFTTTVRFYDTRCLKCGATHVIHPKGLDFRQAQREGGAHIAAGPTRNEGERTEHIDATKRMEQLRRRRELGDAYWRSPD